MAHESGRAIARRGPEPAGIRRLKLQQWVDALPMSAGALALIGLGLATLGIAGAMFNPLGLVGLVVTSSMFTVGAGMTFLAANKGKVPAPRALAAEDPTVVWERSRRVRATMHERAGEWTFEELFRRLRWTEDALVSALVAMRDSGELVEDLNLETGTWVYRLQNDELLSRAPRSLMLEERKAALVHAKPDSD